MRSNGLIILAITAGGAFYVPQSSPSPSTKGTTASNAAGAAVETVAHEEPATDALDLIADYFGIDREEKHAAQTVELRSEAGQTPGTFKLSLETTPESGSKPSDEAWQQRIDVLRQRARDARRNVRFLIVTLPDFVDSHMRWDFDAMLDAVQAAMSR